MSEPALGAMKPLAPPAMDSYTDYKSLAARAGDRSPEALRKAAKQFESVFLHLWLKSMREANAGFGEGSYLSSPAVEAHQQMLDGEMALNLSNSGGIGLADIIERQLSGQGTPVRRESDSVPSMTASRVPPAPGPSTADEAPIEAAAEKVSFIERLSTAVDDVIAGTPLPKLGVLAQAVLETGWGRHIIGGQQGQPGFNLFGIKATGWQGPAVTTSTREFMGGRFVNRDEAFRAYDSIESAVHDYVDVLRGSPRYAALFETAGNRVEDALKEVRRFADTLQKGGYATDPAYADKIVDVARTILRLTGAR